MSRRAFSLFALTFILAACGAMQRSDDAASAKIHMIGMSREDVLACIGPPKKRASEGSITVWSYESTNKYVGGSSDTISGLGDKHTESLSSHDFCTVNVVMKDGVVTRVNYNGPSDSAFAPDEQCGHPVKNCVTADRF